MRIPKYPKHSQANTAIKWLVLYHSYPLLLFVPTIRPKSFGASGHSKAVWAMRPWLNVLRDAIACSAHAEAAPHWNQNLQLWSRQKQQNKKENQANLPQIKRSCVFEKKTEESLPPLPTARFVAKPRLCFRISRKTLKDRDAGDPANAC